MALKTIYYTVGVDGITPPTQRDGGVQGSHNVVQLEFTLASDLKSALTSEVSLHGYSIAYRFDGHTGTGAVKSTEPQTLSVNDTLTYSLENWITKDGGNILVYLVITVMDGEETEIESYSYPAKLRIVSVPSGSGDAADNLPSITTLYEQTAANAQIASEAAESAREDAESAAEDAQRTEESRIILEGDTVFIFQGGNAQYGAGAGVVGLTIDSVFNAQSHNPAESQAIAAYLSNAFMDTVNAAIAEAVDAAKIAVQNTLYPVGQIIYLYNDTSNPHDKYGFGTWVQITEKFLFAASDVESEEATYSGDPTDTSFSGGEATHTLTQEELPHIEGGIYNMATQRQVGITTSVNGVFEASRAGNVTFGNLDAEQPDTLNDSVEMSFGQNQPHNNMPPYICVYVWRRTA